MIRNVCAQLTVPDEIANLPYHLPQVKSERQRTFFPDQDAPES